MKRKNNNKSFETLPEVLCNDTPTACAHLGFRALFTFLAWIVLGVGISEGRTFFVSVTLFVMPTLLDYYKFSPKSNLRNNLNWIAKVVNWLLVLPGMIGIFGALTVKYVNKEYIIVTADNFVFAGYQVCGASYYWLALIITVVICAFDWAVNKSTLETQIVDEEEKKGRR